MTPETDAHAIAERVPSPWFVTHIVDADAAFRYVPANQAAAAAERVEAGRWDVIGDEPGNRSTPPPGLRDYRELLEHECVALYAYRPRRQTGYLTGWCLWPPDRPRRGRPFPYDPAVYPILWRGLLCLLPPTAGSGILTVLPQHGAALCRRSGDDASAPGADKGLPLVGNAGRASEGQTHGRVDVPGMVPPAPSPFAGTDSGDRDGADGMQGI